MNPDAPDFSAFETLGRFTSYPAADNLDVQKENQTHICITTGGEQRVVDVGIYWERNRSMPVPGAASLICCIKDQEGLVSNPEEQCSEEILYLSDAIDKKKHLSGVSVSNLVELSNEQQRLLIIGSFFDGGVGVCYT